MRARTLLLLALLAACKKKEPPEYGAYATKAEALADLMCECKDSACAASVDEKQAQWTTEYANATSHLRTAPYPSTGHKMTNAWERYNACKLQTIPIDAAIPDAAPTDDDAPLAVQGPVDLDRAIRTALDWGKTKRDSAVASIKIEYVDATAALDKDFGALFVTFGFPSENDPKRRVGAPIYRPDFNDKCFMLVLRAGSWTREANVKCAPQLAKPPACRVKDVWAKALAKGAPQDALARIDLWSDPPTWRVLIEDKPRKIHFSEDFPDDCPVTVEATESP